LNATRGRDRVAVHPLRHSACKIGFDAILTQFHSAAIDLAEEDRFSRDRAFDV
jgi:hypothetical protein